MNDSKGGKGSKRIAFDLDDPKLPAEIEDKALGSGGYPRDASGKGSCISRFLGRLEIKKWDDCSEAQHDIFRFTHTTIAPWTVIRANDQRRARLEAIRVVLSAIPYDGKDEDAVGKPDPKIVGSGPEFFNAD